MEKRQLPDDFKEFIQCLNSHNVRYLLVGGWAVGIYGNPRATKDIDFLIAIDTENIENLQDALSDFGAPTVENKVFSVEGIELSIISRNDLLLNKKASGRHRDLADAEFLETDTDNLQ